MTWTGEPLKTWRQSRVLPGTGSGSAAMRGWAAQAETPITVRTSAIATPARRSAFPFTRRRLRVVVGLVPPDVAHDIVMRAVELIPIACDVLAILDHAVMHLRHPLVQASHTLQLFLEK